MIHTPILLGPNCSLNRPVSMRVRRHKLLGVVLLVLAGLISAPLTAHASGSKAPSHRPATCKVDPGGNVVSTSGSLTSPFGFAGVYTDAESGLLAATHRYYDPTTATWLSVDPLVSRTMQPYQYVAGNPLNLTDRAGLNSTAQDQNPFEVIGGDIEDISGLFGGPLVNLVPEELPNGIDDGGLVGLLDPGDCTLEIGNFGPQALHADAGGSTGGSQPGIGTGGAAPEHPTSGDGELDVPVNGEGDELGTGNLGTNRGNDYTKYLVQKYGLTRDQQRELHDAITGENYDRPTIEEIAQEIREQ